MPALGRLRNLTTVMGSFHGRVLAARLGAEGVIVVLKGVSDGPYPLQGEVEVLVPAEQLALAREILLADEVENAFVDSSSWQADSPAALDQPEAPARRRARVHGAPAALVVVVVITLIVVAFVAAAAH